MTPNIINDIHVLSNQLEQTQNSVDLLSQLFSQIVNTIYPVGSIYMTMSAENPSSKFGGTWEQIKDRFLLAAGDSYAIGITGGAATHTLTIKEMPSHNHTFHMGWGAGPSDSARARTDLNSPANDWPHTGYTGGSQPHNNMPPYLTVYIWKRIS